MKRSDHVINVSEADFDYEVVSYSQKTPVVVDFWAEWCVPCRTLGPLLERLAEEAKGGFRVAKINVDENPVLSRRYNVRSIPAVKGFFNGQVVGEFVGVQPEPRLREFIRSLAPDPADLQLEKAQSLLQSQQWAGAEKIYRDYLVDNPDNPPARLGLAKSLLMQGRAQDAQHLLAGFPASREFTQAELLRPLAEALISMQANQAYSDDPLEASYFNALRLVTRGNLQAAADGLLDVLRSNKSYQNGAARRVILALFEIMGNDNPITADYRRELASVLF